MTSVSSIKSAKRTRGAARKPTKEAEVSPSFKLFLSLDRRTLLFSLALFAAVLAFYSRVAHNGFLDYDDTAYIMENSHAQARMTWETVKWAFTTNYESNWHPLTWLSHSLDCQLFGLNPAGHHWVNVLLHALNAVLLFWLLQSATGFRWRSLMVAALFAFHPINVESVAWAAERKNVLSMLFFLLALYAYVWYARKPAPGRYAAVAGFFALSLMAKPQAVTFPFLLLLFDYWPLDRIDAPASSVARGGSLPKSRSGWRQLAWEKAPLLVLSAASAVVTMIAQSGARDLAHYSLPLRLETAVVSYVRYLGKVFWPSKLVVLYPHPTRFYPAWQMAAAIFLLLLITVVSVRARRQRYLAVGWFWFLGSLVPMIGLVQVGAQAMADRYAYLSFIGLFVMLVWLAADLAKALRISPRWLAVPAAACLLVLGILTYHQVVYWHDSESLWRRTLALTQDNYAAHRDLAGLLHKQGKNDEAALHLRAALAIRPDDLLANLFLGAYEGNRGNLSAALERYQFVASHATKVRLRAQANTELGMVYRQMGQPMKAKQCFETSLQLVPNQPMLMAMLGVIAQKNGDLPEAVRQYQRASALQHTDVEDLLLSQALRQEGRLDEANAVFQRVAHTSPNLAAAEKTAEALLAGK